MIVESLEDAEDVMGEVSIDDITKCIPKASRAVHVESAGGGNKLVKRKKGHLEGENNLRGTIRKEMKETQRQLAKQRKYKARRTIQELLKMKNTDAGCHALYCVQEGVDR